MVRGLLVRIALWVMLLLGSEIVNVDEGELEEELSEVNVEDEDFLITTLKFNELDPPLKLELI